MRFYPLAADDIPAERILADFLPARTLGRLRLGNECLYFKRGFRTFYIPYAAVGRCVRRAVILPDALRKEGQAPEWETLVFYGADDAELAQVSVPGATALRVTMTELARRLPPGALGL